MYVYKNHEDEIKDVELIHKYAQYIFIKHESVFGYYPNTFQLEAILHLFEIYCIQRLGELALGLILLKFESRIKIRRLGVDLLHKAFILDPFESSEISNKFFVDYSPLRYTYKTYYRNPIPITPYDILNYDSNICDEAMLDILNEVIHIYQFTGDVTIEYYTHRIKSGNVVPYQYYFYNMTLEVKNKIPHILKQLDSKYSYVQYECRNRWGETEIYVDGRLSE